MSNELHTFFLKVLDDDRNAFRELFMKSSGRLFHLAYSFLHSRELAEETVLDVFTQIWKKRKSLDNVNDIERYLYIAVKNQALHYLRRNYAKDFDQLSIYEVEVISGNDDPESHLINEEYLTLIQQAVDSLPPRCKEVFRLVLSDKLKNREIADILNISEKTVNEHIALAYKRIGQYVNKIYDDNKTNNSSLNNLILFFL
ncbi:MAG: RNA polymerase sigma-70 factor [Tannerellaceae bacterium]|nr:RNA polymerase sigma-70 factor [Tannerellaceae bacterium]